MFGITFLVPAFLLGLVAAAIPVLLHLLKRTSAARRDFSAVFLIKEVILIGIKLFFSNTFWIEDRVEGLYHILKNLFIHIRKQGKA